MRVGELRGILEVVRLCRRIDQIKAGLSTVIHGRYIYTKVWLYCPIRIRG